MGVQRDSSLSFLSFSFSPRSVFLASSLFMCLLFSLLLSFMPMNYGIAICTENFGFLCNKCMCFPISMFFKFKYNHHTYDVSQTIHVFMQLSEGNGKRNWLSAAKRGKTNRLGPRLGIGRISVLLYLAKSSLQLLK